MLVQAMIFFSPLWQFFASWLQKQTRGVSITLWPCPFTLKEYFNAKEELWKLKYFNMQK
jgi:hypothetical protein